MAVTNPDLQDFNPISLKSPSVRVLTEIQSHGILLVLQEPDLKILQVSNNTIGAFEIAPSRVIGQPLEKFLDVFQVEQFRAALADRSFDSPSETLRERSNYTKVWVTKSKDNYRVMLASNGVEAILQGEATPTPLYDRDWENIAVVLLDMMMPNLHTPYIIRALQRINSAVKVVAMSGTSANESFTKCGLCPIADRYAIGAFLTKPFTTPEMLHTLANLELN